MTEIDYTQQFTDLKTEVTALKQYFIDRDAAAALAAQQKAIADAEASEILAAEQLIKDEADALIVAAEKQAETDFRAELLEKSTITNDMLDLLTKVDYLSNNTFTTDSDSPFLAEIAQNTSVTSFENEVGSLSYYADIGIIILIFGVLPIYIAYRFIHPVFGMLNKIF